jgi:hypothetical protein
MAETKSFFSFLGSKCKPEKTKTKMLPSSSLWRSARFLAMISSIEVILEWKQEDAEEQMARDGP